MSREEKSLMGHEYLADGLEILVFSVSRKSMKLEVINIPYAG